MPHRSAPVRIVQQGPTARLVERLVHSRAERSVKDDSIDYRGSFQEFMTNSDGFCAATEWILQQNPGKSKSQVQGILRDYMGCEQTLIVERLYGEGTGHIDMFAKFTSPDTVLVGEYDRRLDSTNAALLDRNAERFEAAMREAYRKALPAGYRVTTVDASEIIYYGGAVHCVTMSFNRSPIGTAPPRPNLSQPEPEPEPEASEVIAVSSSEKLPIEDLRATTSAIQVGVARAAGEVEIEVSIQDTYVGDLLVYVEHAGQRVNLHENGGGSADDIERSYTTPGFEGTPSAGEWRLVIEDSAEQDEGALLGWSLTIQ